MESFATVGPAFCWDDKTILGYDEESKSKIPDKQIILSKLTCRLLQIGDRWHDFSPESQPNGYNEVSPSVSRMFIVLFPDIQEHVV
ncbi:hypothetical protein BaRGS_00038405 [Batillaria attramentaria]|uniref:Uncharacterized protein n=1 Tax=Batillaria attramentaria TaxID=370345 RepID=A0ABD0J5V6_9CAEN